MTPQELTRLLAEKGTEPTGKTFRNHGAPEPLFGVKIGDLKPIARKIKGDQELALRLFATGNSDAMYLAGFVADGRKMSREELNRWAESATWHMISGCSVPWVASEHPDAVEISLEWIESPKEMVAVAGWATLSCLACMIADDQLPIGKLSNLLARVSETIHLSPNRVRYVMNDFVICCGAYVAPLAETALETARAMGRVEVDMGRTSCQVPDAESYILKSRRGLPVAPKRKRVRC
jgi:3-methyladenine DNA glycosylase AlkD